MHLRNEYFSSRRRYCFGAATGNPPKDCSKEGPGNRPPNFKVEFTTRHPFLFTAIHHDVWNLHNTSWQVKKGNSIHALVVGPSCEDRQWPAKLKDCRWLSQHWQMERKSDPWPYWPQQESTEHKLPKRKDPAKGEALVSLTWLVRDHGSYRACLRQHALKAYCGSNPR